MKTIELSTLLSSSEAATKKCKKCKTKKSFSEFYSSGSKRKRGQLSNLLINMSKYTQEYITYKTKCIETDDYCKTCRKKQVKQSQDSKKDKNLAEIINNFWNFHYNKYPNIANYFPGFGNFDNNPTKNTIWNQAKKPYMLRTYTYMFFFQFHNDRHRKKYIDIFFEKYINPELHSKIEVSPTFQQHFHYNFSKQIQLFTIFKFCPKCKEFKQTYIEYENISMFIAASGKYQITPKDFKPATNKTKNGWQRHCTTCNRMVDFPLEPQAPITKQLISQSTLDPIRDRDALYAQIPSEIFDPNPQTGEEK